MSTNITDLLKKAAKAPSPSKSKWAKFVPVVAKLKADKGYSVWQAVTWLITEGEIPEDSRRVAYHSILQGIKRTEGK